MTALRFVPGRVGSGLARGGRLRCRRPRYRGKGGRDRDRREGGSKHGEGRAAYHRTILFFYKTVFRHICLEWAIRPVAASPASAVRANVATGPPKASRRGRRRTICG